LRVVVALGGNALLRRGETPTAEAQRRNLERAGEAIAGVARDHDLVVTHGNGPQVGLLMLQSTSRSEGPRFPLDVVSAESVGMIGYLLETELTNRLPGREVATLLTRVQVDPDDPAFEEPTKPIGPGCDRERADVLAREHGWSFAREGERWRRVVPSPRPLRILELDTIRLLVRHGVLVVCAGGGGLPVIVTGDGRIVGVEAVVDKDRTTALLAQELDADALLLLTDVEGVIEGWGTPEARPIRRASPERLRAMALDPGSMGPKVEAACAFVDATGRPASIGALEDAAALLAGDAGTRVAAG